MSDYSIELAAQKIVDSRTRRYFAEVHGCYSAGHFRSAIVMLWSVAITDILFKLDQLATAYGDTTAESILAEIQTIRTSNTKSPEWEMELVNKVAVRTDLIDQSELTFLKALQAHRHLSAHPVITGGDALFSPNKETARAHIRNILDSILIKPPIMSRNIFKIFMEDVEQLGRLNPDQQGLERFLEAKYFRHFSGATFTHIFKSLWRVTFKSTDARADSNRALNEQTLEVVFGRRKAQLTDLINTERDWFSDIAVLDGHVTVLTRFFQNNPQVFHLLNDALKTPIQTHADLTLDNFATCWFLSPSPELHINDVLGRIDKDEVLLPVTLKELCFSLATSDALSAALRIGIRLYFKSINYDTADTRFTEFIKPFLRAYHREHVLEFISSCENSEAAQATGRGRAASDHREVKALIDEKFPDISIDSYPCFKKQVGR